MRYIFILALFCTACATEAAQSELESETFNYTSVFFAGTKASEEERFLCEGVGGRVERAGRLGAERCIQDLPDAGKTCSDASDCLGRCVIEDADGVPEPGTAANGVCEATDSQFGCTTLVNGGAVEGTLCVD